MNPQQQQKWAIAIHGGAGTILKKNMSDSLEQAYIDKLNEVLAKGEDILKNGGTALDAVEFCIHIMEESPLFNAGVGAVFTNEGKIELDASIMDGSNLMAGAVASITTVKHPISAARKVMEKSPHVMLIGKGAEQFSQEQGLEIVSPDYFFTQKRFDQLQRIKDTEKQQLDHSAESENKDKKFGTVGVVALDKHGNLAAGTSTGGMTNKRYGRVGDAPIIGAGTYANNNTCAVSATGHGEYFIRSVVAHDISALMEYQGLSVNDAANEVVMHKLVKLGGEGGVICIDKFGNVAMPFNSEGMYRGYRLATGETEVLIYK
ncbi:MAG: isoaspartyl peptidase/L-asparaginase family protein [Bacteroidia bacterium]